MLHERKVKKTLEFINKFRKVKAGAIFVPTAEVVWWNLLPF